VYHRAFVYDLSPWGDVTPADDPDQPLGTDLRTYIRMLEANLEQSAGEHMTEVAGFFPFQKYSTVGGLQQKYEPVPTEWETVWLISRYNCYQNTAAGGCYNQSFHSQAPFEPLKQQRPEAPGDVEDKTYVCFLMADYDSTLPLYDFLPRIWDDEMRGKLPAVWGINPNLIETYPDLITYYYETAGGADYFASDASCAGYFNPNRIREEYLPLFTRHNKRFFEQCDMTLAPMVLDWDEPTAAVKDSFVQFAPDGFATIVIDFHEEGGKLPEPHVWKGMPVLELFNEICNTKEAAPMARQMYEAIERRDLDTPAFCFFRTIWTASSVIAEAAELLKSAHPELDVEVVDPYTFFALAEKHYAKE
jgi:hypothetical protein